MILENPTENCAKSFEKVKEIWKEIGTSKVCAKKSAKIAICEVRQKQSDSAALRVTSQHRIFW